MLVEAAYWRAGSVPGDTEAALRRPDLTFLLAEWGRPGDAAVIATSASAQLGAAWYRLWTPERHSYGYVDANTPELGIGVRAEFRGKSVGTALLKALIDSARSQEFAQLSLSVESDNPALRLYERLGFRRHEQLGGAWTMLLRLPPRARVNT